MPLLIEAQAKRDEARAKFDAARIGTRAWREAEEDLQFWIGKVAMLDVMARRVEVAQ